MPRADAVALDLIKRDGGLAVGGWLEPLAASGC
jgi:hypothetical protein